MQISSPYKNTKQETKISLEPYHMNSDIRNNMSIILKKKVEKKCNEYGYIDEVYRIIKYSDGNMPPENLSGISFIDIEYHCKMCIPCENTTIIGQIKVLNLEIIVCVNGPIMIFITKDNIDTNTFVINDGYVNKNTKKKLVNGDFVQVKILNKRINNGDSQIKTIGILIDNATSEQVSSYFGSNVSENKDDEKNNSFII